VFEFANLVIALCLLLGAVLYTSVGHAGSSAYIAVMTLFNLQPTVIRPTALTLNIAVSAYASSQYIRNKFFDKKLFFVLILGAIPSAFIGGHINLPNEIYKPVVGVLLILAGLRFFFLANISTAYGFFNWISRRNNWHRRRNFSITADYLAGMESRKASKRNSCSIYLR
jgi:uncharacterized membrane protein YfcA